MIGDHATIKVSGYSIPLIGVPKPSTLEECDCCHDEYRLQEVERVGVQWLCRKCRSTTATEAGSK